ncbi:MAG: FAD-dependent pyridine nucleotide-disulfide oxidoreductase [Dehalococcoidia bacterium]|nr:FAD-dependent pyridine nucleotide-disulfide oxidoreductase [Dehalococcoidia bacterium]
MARVIVVGGGLSGCGAAIAARKAGHEVTLLERTDMVAGAAVRAGDTGGNGCFTAQHELRFLGGGELFDALASIKLHDNVAFPDVSIHGYIYNTGLVEPTIRRVVEKVGVKVLLESRMTNVVKEGSQIKAVKVEDGRLVEGEVFVDCTGTRGGVAICNKYGKGCVMCLFRCVSFGDRVSIVEKAGGKESFRYQPDGKPGRIGGGIFLFKDTLAADLKARIEEEGLVRIPLPKHLIDYSHHQILSGNRSNDFLENIVMTDIGPVAKCSAIGPMKLDKLRQVPGLENAQVEDPRSPRWNHVSDIGIAERDNSLKVKGFANLFCAGEKSGQTSVDGAIITGYLAGHNAARNAAGADPLELPTSLAIGDYMAFATEKLRTGEALKVGCRLSRGEYWERMQEIGLFTDDVGKIKSRVEKTGLAGILSRKVTD